MGASWPEIVLEHSWEAGSEQGKGHTRSCAAVPITSIFATLPALGDLGKRMEHFVEHKIVLSIKIILVYFMPLEIY